MKKKEIDFIGIGAPKSGSTWVAKCLEEHPQILSSSLKTRKELFFFNTDNVWGDNSTGRMSYYKNGIDWYIDQFPSAKKGHVRGEYSVSYMADPEAYSRIKKHLPNVKILAVIRNPIDMIYSLHWYFYNGAVIDIPKEFKKTLDRGLFIDKGFYYKHLKKFYDNFPKENIQIILYDDLVENPQKTLAKVYKFLGVDSTFHPPSLEKRVNQSFRVKSTLFKNLVHIGLAILDILKLDKLRLRIFENKKLAKIYSVLNKTPAHYPKMSLEDRKRCLEIYRDDINSLEKLLNRDLSSWKKLYTD